MSDVTIYHNPNCSSSRFAVDSAAERGVDAEVVLYLKTQPDANELGALLDKLEDPPADLVRKDSFFESLGLDAAAVTTRQQVIDLLVEHPRLLQRPVLVKGDQAVIGRPRERVGELLGS